MRHIATIPVEKPVNFPLTDDEAKLLYDTLMQLPNQSNTYPLLVKLVNTMREHAEPKPETEEVEIN